MGTTNCCSTSHQEILDEELVDVSGVASKINQEYGVHITEEKLAGILSSHRHKHPSWAAVLVRPCTHGLIQAADPAWGELFCHIGIPCLYDLSDLPEAIPEGWWLPCCDCKGLQDRFKPFPRHE